MGYSWLLCVFINTLSWECVLRILDILLYQRDAQVHVRVRAVCGWQRLLYLCQGTLCVCHILLYQRDAQVHNIRPKPQTPNPKP
jgi:hypothetical protein